MSDVTIRKVVNGFLVSSHGTCESYIAKDVEAMLDVLHKIYPADGKPVMRPFCVGKGPDGPLIVEESPRPE